MHARAAPRALAAKRFSTAATFPPPLHFFAGARQLSPWHDIPLRTGAPGVFNFVNEIPRGGRAKMEIDTSKVRACVRFALHLRAVLAGC